MTDHDVIPAPPAPRVPVRGGGTFPVRRIYCVGRNFADHAKEMGATAPASKAERGQPVFCLKPGDAIATDGVVPYPRGTQDRKSTRLNPSHSCAARMPTSAKKINSHITSSSKKRNTHTRI